MDFCKEICPWNVIPMRAVLVLEVLATELEDSELLLLILLVVADLAPV